MRTRTLAVLAAVLCFSLASFSQNTTGTISGTVGDSSGAVLPGANVLILNEDTGISRTVQTDSSGRYLVPLLSLGKYRVTVSKDGFQSEARSGIVLTLGREAVVNVQLSVGVVNQTVEVTGEAPLVESTSSTVGGLVDERTIRELPLNGRSYDQLALLEAGVTSYGGGGATTGGFLYGTGTRFSVAGSRSYNNSYLLDGTDINDSGNGTPGGAAGTNLGVDAIREFKIITSLFAAEYGRATGAIITAVTKSGTNDYHGSLFHFLRNSAMDARNFFDSGSKPPAFKRNQFGGTYGGPIKKDRTFFFGAYEGMRERLGLTQISIVPTIEAKQGIAPLPGQPDRRIPVSPAIKPYLVLWPDPNGRNFGDGTAEYQSAPSRPTNQDYFMVRIDHQLSEHHSIFGRYTFDNDTRTTPTPLGTSSNILSARRQYATFQMSSVLSPTVLNSARIAFNRAASLSDNLPADSIPSGLSFIPGQPVGVINIGGRASGAALIITSAGTADGQPRYAYYSLFEYADDLTLINGRHSWKFGGNFKRMRDNTAQNTSLRGIYQFTSFDTVLTATPTNFGAVPPGQSAYRGVRQNIFAAFAQDDFRLTPRLTFNLGVRYEGVSDPTEVNHLASRLLNITDPKFSLSRTFIDVTARNLEPRAGFAWQLNGSGKTVIRGGFGIYHDQILPVYYAVAVTKYPPFYNRLAVDNPNFPNGYLQLASSGLVQINGVAPELKTPAKNHYTFSLQQQLFKETVLELAYIGSKGTNVTRYAEANTRPYIMVNGQKFFPSGSANPNDVIGGPRKNPGFDEVRPLLTDTNAHYDGLQVKLKRASNKNLQMQVSYTYSRAMDVMSTVATIDNSREAQSSLDPEDPNRDKGRASFDATHNLVINVGYPIPFHFGNRAASLLIGGWELSGIGTFTGGQPFTARLGSERSRNGGGGRADRPNLKPGANSNAILGTVERWYDPTVFALPAIGTYGNLGRNTLIGPNRQTVDFSLTKRFVFSESKDLQFRAELFNILNRANFGLPQNVPLTSTGTISGSAGRISDTITTSRQIQFGLKLSF